MPKTKIAKDKKTKIAKDKNKKKKILSGFIIYYEKIYRNIFSLL